jgi:hypothetical protein
MCENVSGINWINKKKVGKSGRKCVGIVGLQSCRVRGANIARLKSCLYQARYEMADGVLLSKN